MSFIENIFKSENTEILKLIGLDAVMPYKSTLAHASQVATEMHPHIIEALEHLIKNPPFIRLGEVVKPTKGIALEFDVSDDTTIVILAGAKMYVAVVENGEWRSFDINRDPCFSIILAVLPTILQDNEAKKYYDDGAKDFFSNPNDNNNIKSLCQLNDYISHKLFGMNTTIDNPAQMTSSLAKRVTVETDQPMKYYSVTGNKSSPMSTSVDDFTGSYSISTRELSDEERKRIPKIGSNYIMPEYVPTICNLINKSPNIRNIMLQGGAGSGKTEAAKVIASGLGLPYLSYCCSANTEIFDLVGQILPNISSQDAVPDWGDRTDYADIYFELTGDILPEATREDCLRIYKTSKTNNNDYIFVESPLVEALRYGYVCEIQEPTVIMQQGVLVGLNSMLDNCKRIQLITGEVVERHPDCVFIVTTNSDYVGCNELNQSFLSRFQIKKLVNTPDIEECTKRVSAKLNFSDISLLTKMTKAMKEIQYYRQSTGFTSGSCGMRELEAWAETYLTLSDVMAAAELTIIPSAANFDEEEMDNVRQQIEKII